MKVCFHTFGCRLNRAEALEEEARYLAAGYQVVPDHRSADLIVIRGCSVTGRAESECRALVEHVKAKYPQKRLRVVGCYRDKIPLALPKLVTAEEPLPLRTARAFLKVQDGCSGGCSYCIVPQFRGPSVSLGFSALVERARRLVAAGYHEIVVTGCNLALYASEGKRLPELVAALAAVDPACRIRLGSLEPATVVAETIDVMAAHANICRSFYLSVQSGSDAVLHAMRRPYRIDAVDALVDRAVRAMPGLGLGCDLIAGFPGETELDFLASVSFLRRHGFIRVHAFPYSARPGTEAARIFNQLPHAIRSSRAHELSRIALAAHGKFTARQVGRVVEVVGEEHGFFAGWTGEYLRFEEGDPATVRVRRPGGGRRRELHACIVRKVRGGVLYGSIVDGR